MSYYFKYIPFFALLLLLLSSCNNQGESNIDISSDNYHMLYDKLTEIMINDVYSPPVASRVYVYPNIAAYEVLAANSDNLKSLGYSLDGLNASPGVNGDEVNLKLAAILAYLDVAKELVFSKNRILSYSDSLNVLWRKKNKTQFEVSRDYAVLVSNEIKKWMGSDNYRETRSMPKFNIDYTDTSRWVPTPPAYMDGIEPHWNKIRSFCLDSSSQFKPPKHPVFDLTEGSEFYKELYEVYSITNRINQKGDESEEVKVAKFWDCNPFVSVNRGHYMFSVKKISPGAHWIGICKIACQDNGYDFEDTVYAYTKTTIAITDAFISCWDEKYRSNLIRPETLINSQIDENWLPLLQTPPFPEYTSGHSVVSAAASTTLSSIFGEDYDFVDTTEIEFGLPARHFESFDSAAREAAISRVYGGIHYRSAVENGFTQGLKVGNQVLEKLSFMKAD